MVLGKIEGAERVVQRAKSKRMASWFRGTLGTTQAMNPQALALFPEDREPLPTGGVPVSSRLDVKTRRQVA